MSDAKQPSFQTFVDLWRENWRTVDAVYHVLGEDIKRITADCERAVADGDAETLAKFSQCLTKGRGLLAEATAVREKLLATGTHYGIIANGPKPEERQQQLLRLPASRGR